MNTSSAATAAVDQILEQFLRDIGIPPRPAILNLIAAEMHKETPNLKILAQAINSDVGLAASLIKTANSPYFGTRGRARSANEALQILGLNIAIHTIAGIILRQVFPASPQLDRFWDASAQIASLSGWLAQQFGHNKLHSEDAYTYGLFRDAGIPVMLKRFPTYAAILAKANDEATRPFMAVEQDFFPTDHTMVGCLLARNWCLPEEICLAIRHHHELHALERFESGMPVISRHLIATAQLAEYIFQQETGLCHTEEWPKLGTACLRLLDLTAEELPELCAVASQAMKTEETAA